MGTVLKIYAPGDVRFDTYEERPLEPKELRLKTLYTGISAGTELTHFRGTNPFRTGTWDAELSLFSEKPNEAYYPRSTGYEEVGEVVECGSGTEKIREGEIIFGQWQHRSTHIMTEEQAAGNRLLPELDPVQGIFAQIGAIAYNAVLEAAIHVGETVVVFGQGTPGLICTALAALSGARVIAVDLHEKRRTLAERFGAAVTLDPAEESPGETVKRMTGGLGADVVIEASGSVPALSEAIKSCVASGKVVALGFYQGGAEGLRLGEEFHHNRISLVCSQIGGINPALSNRWNLNRLHRTVMEFQRDGKLPLKELITHREHFRNALDLYRIIDGNPSEVLQAVLTFE